MVNNQDMEMVIFFIDFEEKITLRYLFQKDEEGFCPIKEKFFYLIQTSNFFERINKLERKIIEKKQFNEKKKESKKILEAIKKFKNEHYENVMNKRKYSCMLHVEKKDIDDGFFGWKPVFRNKYLINLNDKQYNERKKLCFLTDDENNFLSKYREEFNFYKVFFLDDFFYDDQYNIPTDFIFKFKRKYFQKIRSNCTYGANFVCPSDNLCRPHKFIFFIEKIFEAMTHCVIEEKIYYKYFLFKIKKNSFSLNEISGWDFIPSGIKDLSKLSYSQRLSYLNWFYFF